jgi:hypothetical protein
MKGINMEGLVLSSTTDSQAAVDRAMEFATTRTMPEPKEAEVSEAEKPAAAEIAPDADKGDPESKKPQKPTHKPIVPEKEFNRAKRKEFEAKEEARKAVERANALELENKALKEQRNPANAKGEIADIAGDPQPIWDAGTFISFDEFLNKRDEWRDRKIARENEVKSRKQFNETRAETYNRKLEEYWESRPEEEQEQRAQVQEEFMDEIMKLPKYQQTALAEALHDLEDGPQVSAYLIKNPEMWEKIAKWSPLRMAAELGKIEDRITGNKSSPELKTRTRAPAPISPVGGSSKRLASIEDPNISTEQYFEIRNQARRGR